jgi:hypothetical protein
VHAVDDGVVGPAVLDQFEQLLLERTVFLAQDQHLAFHERNGRAAALVRQLQPREHAAVPLEKFRMRHQEFSHLLFGRQGSLDAAYRFIHFFLTPANWRRRFPHGLRKRSRPVR